jgi:hypothetical protein
MIIVPFWQMGVLENVEMDGLKGGWLNYVISEWVYGIH